MGALSAIVLLLAVAAGGCHRRLATPRLPSGCDSFTVQEDRILCGEHLFAEVQRFAAGPGGCTGIRGYRGVAVRYATGERVWLFRVGSLDPDHPERYGGPRSEGEFQLGWVGDVELSPDGRKVSFRKPRFLFPERHEYDVATGTLREVDWTEPPPELTRAPCSAAGPAR